MVEEVLVIGLVAGHFLGLIHGPEAFPQIWLEQLELRDVIEPVAWGITQIPSSTKGRAARLLRQSGGVIRGVRDGSLSAHIGRYQPWPALEHGLPGSSRRWTTMGGVMTMRSVCGLQS